LNILLAGWLAGWLLLLACLLLLLAAAAAAAAAGRRLTALTALTDFALMDSTENSPPKKKPR
jgi:hypothetical protein